MKKWVLIPVIGLGLGANLTTDLALSKPAVVVETAPIWYNCLTREVFTPEKQAWCDRWKILQNATYTVPASLAPDAPPIQVTLKNGRYQRQDGKFFVQLVNERGWMAFGDINGDGQQDAAVILGVALDPAGKSIATYLTTVLNVDGKARTLTPIRLGERIRLNGPIAIKNNSITVPFLTQKEVINQVYVIDEVLRRQT
jgi:hypothetical protein